MEPGVGSGRFKPGKFIGSLVLLGGVVIAVELWGAGYPVKELLITIFLYGLFGFWIILTEEGIITGKLIAKTGYVYRDKNPKSFRFLVVLYIILIFFFLSGMTVYHLEELGLM